MLELKTAGFLLTLDILLCAISAIHVFWLERLLPEKYWAAGITLCCYLLLIFSLLFMPVLIWMFIFSFFI